MVLSNLSRVYAQCNGRALELAANNGLFRDRTDTTSDEYAPNLDCFWLIRPNGARQIRLTFTQFATEEGYDVVTVYDGADTTARVLGIFSGTSLPPSIVSSGGVMLVRFESDGSTENLGWTATYFSSTQPVNVTINPSSLVFENTIFGNVSLDSVLVGGRNLQGNFRVVAPVGFRVAAGERGPFVDTLIVPNRDSVVTGLKVYVQFNPPAPGQYSGRLLVWNGTGITSAFVSGISPPAMFWEPTNGPFAGRIRSLALGGGNTILAGTFGGIYRSNSNGAAWTQSNDGLTSSAAQTINGILPTPKGIFIATNRGVFRSLNNGRSWQSASNGLPRNENGLAQRVSALTGRNDTLLVLSDNRPFRSFNGGMSWQPLEVEVQTDDETPTAVFTAGDVLYVATYSSGRQQVFIYMLRYDSDEIAVDDTFPSFSPITCFTLQDNTLFAGTEEDFIYRSDNVGDKGRGGDWDHVVFGGDNGSAEVAALANGGGVLYAATSDGVWRSNDNGKRWEQPLSSRRSLTDIERTMRSLLVNGADVYVGTDAGVFRSSNKGGSWERANTGLSAAVVTSIREHRGLMIAATAGSGVFRSNDNGVSWTNSNSGLAARFINAFASKGRDVYAVGYDNFTVANPRITPGVFRSQDNGTSWTTVLIDTSFVVNSQRKRSEFHALFPGPRAIFAAGERGLIRRTFDNGGSWDNVRFRLDSVFVLRSFSGELFVATTAASFNRRDVRMALRLDSVRNIITTQPFVTQATITCLQGGNGSTLFAGTEEAGLYRSDNSDNPNPSLVTWSEVLLSRELEGEPITVYAMARNGTTPSASIFVATDHGLFRTVTNGRTWARMDGLPDSLLTISLYVNDGIVYVGTASDGVWRSLDDGLLWEKINDGLNDDADIYAIASNQSTDLYIGLGGNVIYRSSLQLSVNTSRVFLEIPDTLSAAAGEFVEIPIVLRSLQSRPSTLPFVSGVLRFNASMLDPINQDSTLDFRQEAVVAGERLIPFRFRLVDAPGRRIGSFQFRARLGNSVATPLTLTSLSADGVIVIAPKPGIFTLRGLSEAGGTRLFRSERQPILLASAPNPADGITTVRYELTEQGTTTLTILNLFGQPVKTLVSVNALPGEYEAAFDVHDMTPGVYWMILQTPSRRLSQQLHVVR
jgi:photosystem II stability/assembly factor-like uncharacterized protein